MSLKSQKHADVILEWSLTKHCFDSESLTDKKKKREKKSQILNENLLKMTSLMNIGLLLDCCGIYYTDEQVEKLEKLVENFIEKIIREKTGAADTKSENLNVKEEEPENLTENDENFSQNFMSSDICDIELKEEDDQDQEYQGK